MCETLKFVYIKYQPILVVNQECLLFEGNYIFGSFFLDNWNCTFFLLRKRNRLNPLFDRNFQMPVGRVLGTYHVNKKNLAAKLPVVRDVLSDDLENYIFGEGDNFFFRLLQHPHFIRETSNQHPHCFHSMYLRRPEARWKPESCK